MSRTKRHVAYKYYWGWTEKEHLQWLHEIGLSDAIWVKSYMQMAERDFILRETDAKNNNPSTHEWFNRAHRVGRRIERDSLRPHLVMHEDYDFDDSRYRRKLKGIWWEIY